MTPKEFYLTDTARRQHDEQKKLKIKPMYFPSAVTEALATAQTPEEALGLVLQYLSSTGHGRVADAYAHQIEKLKCLR